MLTQCARNFRRAQHSSVRVYLRLQPVQLGGCKINHHSYATDQEPKDLFPSTADVLPWEQNSKTLTHHPRARNIVFDDLQATVKAHGLINAVRKIRTKDTPRGSFVNGKSVNKDGIRVGGEAPLQHKNERYGIYRPNLAALGGWMGDKGVQLRDNPTLMERPLPSTNDLEERESDRKSEWERSPPNERVPLRFDNGATQDPLPTRGQWATPQDQVGGDPQRPWLKLTNVDTGDAMRRLTAEIQAFESYMTLTEAEERAAQSTILLINAAAQKFGLENVLSFHGSRCTGLASPLSDLDVHFAIPEYEKKPGKRGPSLSRPEAKKEVMKTLGLMQRAFQSLPRRVHDLELIYARIPLVIGFDCLAKIAFQCMALTPVRSSLEFTAYYLSQHPNLRPLYFLLRHALLIRNLDVVKDGGLGSYPLFVMILAALNHDVGHIPRDDLASQLLHVLKFWANASLHRDGYSADPPRVFPKVNKAKAVEGDAEDSVDDACLRGIAKLRKLYPEQPFLLCLQDPGDPVNDLGRKAWQIRQIQTLFRRTHALITERMAEYEEMSSVEQRRNWDKAILDSLVRGSYGSFEEQRRLVEARFSKHNRKPFESSRHFHHPSESINKSH